MGLLEQYKRYRVTYRNWIAVMFYLWRGKKTVRVVLRDGKVFHWNSYTAFSYSVFVVEKNVNPNVDINFLFENDAGSIEFKYNNYNLVLKGTDDNGDIMGVFLLEEYKFLKVDGENVIDICANIGDSPIYFAINGAKKVIALEPYPYSYNIANENIKEKYLYSFTSH